MLTTFKSIGNEAFNHFKSLYLDEEEVDIDHVERIIQGIPYLVYVEDIHELQNQIVNQNSLNKFGEWYLLKHMDPVDFLFIYPKILWSINKYDLWIMLKYTKNKLKIGGIPISLCNSSYKILTKILVNYAKKNLQNVISKW